MSSQKDGRLHRQTRCTRSTCDSKGFDMYLTFKTVKGYEVSSDSTMFYCPICFIKYYLDIMYKPKYSSLNDKYYELGKRRYPNWDKIVVAAYL